MFERMINRGNDYMAVVRGGLTPPPPSYLGWEVHPGRQIFTYNFDFTPRIHHFFQNFPGGHAPGPPYIGCAPSVLARKGPRFLSQAPPPFVKT